MAQEVRQECLSVHLKMVGDMFNIFEIMSPAQQIIFTIIMVCDIFVIAMNVTSEVCIAKYIIGLKKSHSNSNTLLIDISTLVCPIIIYMFLGHTALDILRLSSGAGVADAEYNVILLHLCFIAFAIVTRVVTRLICREKLKECKTQ